MRASGSDFMVFFYIFIKLVVHSCAVLYEVKLSKYAEVGESKALNCEVEDICDDLQHSDDEIIASYKWYSILFGSTFGLGIIVSVIFFQLLIFATKNLHDIALAGLLKSPMRFFNINPPGRILNRFSQGIYLTVV